MFLGLSCWASVLMQVIAKSPIGAVVRSLYPRKDRREEPNDWDKASFPDLIAYCSEMLKWSKCPLVADVKR
jgi:hypothetical protein